MCTCKVCCTDDRTKIMRILNIIQDKDKRIFSFFLCLRKNIFYTCIFIGCHLSDYALMCAC